MWSEYHGIDRPDSKNLKSRQSNNGKSKVSTLMLFCFTPKDENNKKW